MENKIQELTEKIYAEGVEKGNVEAARIVEEAKEKASDIVSKAKAEAEAIVAAAEKKATELEEHSRSEIKLYGAQAVNALKSEAANIVTDSVTKAAVKEALAGDTIKALLVKIAERWSANEQLVISTSEADDLKGRYVGRDRKLW